MRATLISTDGAQQVRVKDLTSEGAGIACEAPLQPGTDVILELRDLFVAARVVWAERTMAGLEFYRQLPAAELGSFAGTANARALWPADGDDSPGHGLES